MGPRQRGKAGVTALACLTVFTACGSKLSTERLEANERRLFTEISAAPRPGDATAPAASPAGGSTPTAEPGSHSQATPGPTSAAGQRIPGSATAGSSSAAGAATATTAKSAGAGGKAGGKVAAAPNPAPGATGATGTSPATCTGAKSPILLGSFGQESGPLGAVFRPQIAASRAWQADVNARGGLSCHPVKILFGDDNGDPSRALAIVRKMVEEDKVLAIYSQHAATSLAGVTPYLESKNIPFVGACPCNPVVDSIPMSFHPSVGVRGTAWSHILPLLQVPGPHKLATMTCREIEQCTIYADQVKQFAPQIGSQVVFNAQVTLAQPDYTAELVAARNAGADTIVSILPNVATTRIARSAKQQGWNPIITNQHGADADSFFKGGGSDVDGILIAASTAEWSASEEMKPYRDAMAKYQPGEERGGFGADAWAAGKLLEAASANLLGSARPDSS